MPRAHSRAYRRRTGARCYTDLIPPVHDPALPRSRAPSLSFSDLFLWNGDVDLRADDGTLPFPPRIAFLPSFHPFAPRARGCSLCAYFPTPSTISRAPPCSAPSTCVQLASRTATLRPHF
ncbi:hypothetical protein C8F04DRAFT_1243039, partial [Mycena alexandri]